MARCRSTTTACPLMNSQRLPRGNALKKFSEIERRFIRLARRHRADYLRLLKRLKASASKNGRHPLLIAAFVLGLFTTSALADTSAPGAIQSGERCPTCSRLGPA